jgi:hypothetical protein
MSTNFTEIEHLEILMNHSWMEKYYGTLNNAIIRKVEISIDDEDRQKAFLNLHVELANSDLVLLEVLSNFDSDEPGFISGLPFVN